MPLLKCSASKAKPKIGIRYIIDPKKAALSYVGKKTDKNLLEIFKNA